MGLRFRYGLEIETFQPLDKFLHKQLYVGCHWHSIPSGVEDVNVHIRIVGWGPE